MDHPRANPHSAIRAIAPDVYVVSGEMTLAPFVTIQRNMCVVVDDGELTIINAVRLSEEGERELAALGTVRNLVKLGAFHERDDPYYVERYKPLFWALPKAHHRVPLSAEKDLVEGARLPLPGMRLVAMSSARLAEAALFVPRGGGVLVTCDSLQSLGATPGLNAFSRVALWALGFRNHPVQVAPTWLRTARVDATDLRADYQRLLELQFAHLVTGHGPPVLGTAPDAVRAAIDRAFGAESPKLRLPRADDAEGSL